MNRADALEIVGDCNNSECVDPMHDRAVAFRLAGKRWSEIAVELGITTVTLWRHRTSCPHIGWRITAEQADYLQATQAALAALLPDSVRAVREIVNDPTHKDRLQAAKVNFDVFRKERFENLTPGEIITKLRHLGTVSDDDLERDVIDAVAEAVQSRRKDG